MEHINITIWYKEMESLQTKKTNSLFSNPPWSETAEKQVQLNPHPEPYLSRESEAQLVSAHSTTI